MLIRRLALHYEIQSLSADPDSTLDLAWHPGFFGLSDHDLGGDGGLGLADFCRPLAIRARQLGGQGLVEFFDSAGADGFVRHRLQFIADSRLVCASPVFFGSGHLPSFFPLQLLLPFESDFI